MSINSIEDREIARDKLFELQRKIKLQRAIYTLPPGNVALRDLYELIDIIKEFIE